METGAGYIQAQCPVSMYLKMYSINLQVQFTSSMYWFNVADLSGLLSIILRPDHAVGVLRYITCRDGQRATRRDGDGLMGSPHTHYRRSIFGCHLLHKYSDVKILE